MLSVLADVGGLMAGGLEGAWFVFLHFPSYLIVFFVFFLCVYFLVFCIFVKFCICLVF